MDQNTPRTLDYVRLITGIVFIAGCTVLGAGLQLIGLLLCIATILVFVVAMLADTEKPLATRLLVSAGILIAAPLFLGYMLTM